MNFPGLGSFKSLTLREDKEDMLRPKGYRLSLYSLALSTITINLLSLALPVMTLQVYDRILPNPGTGTLPVLITGVCLAVVLEGLLRICRAYMIGRASAAYEHRMACLAMQRVLNADFSKMGRYGVGEHLHRMGAVAKLKDFYNGFSVTVYLELALLPLFFGLIAYIGGVLVLVPAVILTVFTAVSLVKGFRLRQALQEREQSDDKRFNFLIEALEGVHTVKSFALERFFERRYEALEEHSTAANYKVTQNNANIFNISAVFSHAMVASVVSFGAMLVLMGGLTTGGLIACLLLSGRIMQPIQKLLVLWARYQDYKLARTHLETLMRSPQHVVKERDSSGDVAPDGRLQLDGVRFRYSSDDEDTIGGVDLDLRRGEVVLVSGEHGSGKTTLLKLIAGIYPSSSGEILVDGEDIGTYKAEDLVRHVGYIRAQPMIFRGTIRDNITCFGQTSEKQAREVAALLDVDKDVAKLPSGFDTFLSGNSTDVIPPGLKQRIAIVRVLATKPRIILFDNADRSLDKDGYAMIYSLLARLRGKASMILVSDDKNIRSLANRHYVLRDGVLGQEEDAQSKGNVTAYKELRL